MSADDPNHPLAAFRFHVEFDGEEHGAFSEISGLDSETEVIEYRNGNDPLLTVHKVPGLTKYGNITLKRGYVRDGALWSWRKSIVDGFVERRTVKITLLDERGDPAIRWELSEAWPAKWKGAELKATGNAIAIEALELAHEGVDQSYP